MKTRSPFTIHAQNVDSWGNETFLGWLSIVLIFSRHFVEDKQAISICISAVPASHSRQILSLTLTAAPGGSAWSTRARGWASSCPGVHGPDLDAISLIVDVENAFLDFVIDFPGGVDEGFLHVSGSLSGGLHEDETVLPSKCFSLLSFDISPGFQVTEIKKS